MTSMPGYEAMVNLAKNYANELDSQFRTLNHFVTHAGEIGRAHETYMRGILTRFLPDNIRLSTGFVAHPRWISRQQDILIHNRDIATMFEVGDCTVIDHEAFIGTIEVKTGLTSTKAVCEAVKIQAELCQHKTEIVSPNNHCHNYLFGIYAWEGVPFHNAISGFWEFVKEDPHNNLYLLPNVLCVRGQYIMMANIKVSVSSSPYNMWIIGDQGITEGEALLVIVSAIWEFGIHCQLTPWWIHHFIESISKRSQPVDWPNDLKQSFIIAPKE